MKTKEIAAMIWLCGICFSPFAVRGTSFACDTYFVLAVVSSAAGTLSIFRAGKSSSHDVFWFLLALSVARTQPQPRAPRAPRKVQMAQVLTKIAEPRVETKPEKIAKGNVITLQPKADSYDEIIMGCLHDLPQGWLAAQKDIADAVNRRAEQAGMKKIAPRALAGMLRNEIRLKTKKTETGTKYLNRFGLHEAA